MHMKHGALLLTALLAGCGGSGGGSASGASTNPGNAAATFDGEFVSANEAGFLSVFEGENASRIFKGAAWPLDLSMPVLTYTGEPLTDVQEAKQQAFVSDGSAGQGIVTGVIDDYQNLSGHRATMSDGSFIDFGCEGKGTLTFAPDSPHFKGTFIVQWHADDNSEYDELSRFGIEFGQGIGEYEYDSPLVVWRAAMPDYAGYSPSYDTNDILAGVDFINPRANAKAALSVGSIGSNGLVVESVVRWGDYDLSSQIGTYGQAELRPSCAKSLELYRQAPTGFEKAGASYRVDARNGGFASQFFDPFYCHLADGGPVSSLYNYSEISCAAWRQEKGW